MNLLKIKTKFTNLFLLSILLIVSVALSLIKLISSAHKNQVPEASACWEPSATTTTTTTTTGGCSGVGGGCCGNDY